MMTVIKMDRHSTLLSILFFYGYNNQKEGRNKEPNPFSFYRYFLNFLFFEIISGSVFICLKKREYLHFSINWTFFKIWFQGLCGTWSAPFVFSEINSIVLRDELYLLRHWMCRLLGVLVSFGLSFWKCLLIILLRRKLQWILFPSISNEIRHKTTHLFSWNFVFPENPFTMIKMSFVLTITPAPMDRGDQTFGASFAYSFLVISLWIF